MADRDVKIKIEIDADAAKKGLSEVTKEATALGKEGGKGVFDLGSRLKELNDPFKKGIANMAAATAEAKRVATETRMAAIEAKNLAEAQKKAGQEAVRGFGKAAQSALRFGRGVAFLAAGMSDKFAEALKTVAMFQGAFDVFKGGVDAIKATVAAMKALKVATGAATIAEAIYTGVKMGAIAVTNTLTASLLAMWVALGPIGWAVIAVTVAVAALAAVWYFFSGAEKELTPIEKEIKQLEKALDGTAAEAHKVHLELAKIKREGRIKAIDLIEDPKQKLDKIREELKTFKGETIDPYEGERYMPVAGAEATVTREATYEGMVETIGQEIDLLKTQRELERDIHEQKQDQLKTELDKLQAAKDQAKEAKRALQQEENAMRIKFGMLNKFEQARLKILADKARSGEPMTRAELNQFSQLGGERAQPFVRQEFRRRGAGADDVMYGLPETQAQRGAQQAERRFEFLGGESRMDEIAIEAEELRKKDAAAQAAYIETMNAAIEQQTAYIEALILIRAKIAEMEKNVQDLTDKANNGDVDGLSAAETVGP